MDETTFIGQFKNTQIKLCSLEYFFQMHFYEIAQIKSSGKKQSYVDQKIISPENGILTTFYDVCKTRQINNK